jgi:hypothetical protein
MNRHQRRSAKHEDKHVKPTQESKDTLKLKPSDTMSTEAQVLGAALQDAIHTVMREQGLADPESRTAKAPLIIQGLGLTAAGFSVAVGITEVQFAEAMILYYRQVLAVLGEAKEYDCEGPLIVVPGKEN